MTCKDCIHDGVCGCRSYEEQICIYFTDKAQCIELPCKVRDTVYYINTYYHMELYQNAIYEAKVARFVITNLDVSFILHIRGHNGLCETPAVNAFGKTVFLTREEAENALAKMKGGAE